MTKEPQTEVLDFKCPYCDQTVTTYWAKGGGLLPRPETYTLIADWIFHTPCWNAQVEKMASLNP